MMWSFNPPRWVLWLLYTCFAVGAAVTPVAAGWLLFRVVRAVIRGW
jgi:hypothetical protein